MSKILYEIKYDLVKFRVTNGKSLHS